MRLYPVEVSDAWGHLRIDTARLDMNAVARHIGGAPAQFNCVAISENDLARWVERRSAGRGTVPSAAPSS